MKNENGPTRATTWCDSLCVPNVQRNTLIFTARLVLWKLSATYVAGTLIPKRSGMLSMACNEDGMKFFNRNGEPIDLWQFAALMEDAEYKQLARTTIVSASNLANSFAVSTVWLGIDHSFGHGPIEIFETMVFGEGELDRALWRYSTEAQAYAGHTDTVTLVAATMEDPVIADMRQETSRDETGN